LTFGSNGKRAITVQKFIPWMLAFASLLIVKSSFAFDGVRIVGTAEKLQIELSNATVGNALVALRSAFNFECRCSPPIDRRVTGVYRGNIGRVLSRLLEGYDYVIKTSPSGAVEVIVFRANASPQPNPSYASSPATTVVDDETRGRASSNLSQPSPSYASAPATVLDDETRGRPSRGPPSPTDEQRH
jgi:hypothetical protein